MPGRLARMAEERLEAEILRRVQEAAPKPKRMPKEPPKIWDAVIPVVGKFPHDPFLRPRQVTLPDYFTNPGCSLRFDAASLKMLQDVGAKTARVRVVGTRGGMILLTKKVEELEECLRLMRGKGKHVHH